MSTPMPEWSTRVGSPSCLDMEREGQNESRRLHFPTCCNSQTYGLWVILVLTSLM